MILALLAACAPQPIDAPFEIDPAYAVAGARRWALIGDPLTPGHDRFELVVTPPPDVRTLEVWLDGARVHRGAFTAPVDIAGLEAGEHELLLAADGVGFGRLPFVRTHPVYVFSSVDWESGDTSNAALARQDELHDRHPRLIVTHLVGPYTFTDPDLPAARRAALVDWLLDARDDRGDEIGVHIHPWCHFVEAAGLTCRVEPSFVGATDPSGYAVGLYGYDRHELVTMFETAAALFEQNGLGTPTSFRAGGWGIDLDGLLALDEAGFLVDTSANNWARMEEWRGQPGTSLYAWNEQNWAPIGDTSQPWHPSEDDLFEPGELALLEVPDNGILVDYVTGPEMVDILEANWPGGALAEPVALSIGWHNTLSSFDAPRLHHVYDHLDARLATDDAGPVIYARLSDSALVWP